MAGGVNDPDELVVNSFKAYDEEVEEKIKGQIVRRHILEKENFAHILTAFGDKLTEDELDDIFGEFEYDDNGDILTKSVVDLLFRVPWMRRKRRRRRRKEPLLRQRLQVTRVQRRKRRRRRLL